MVLSTHLQPMWVCSVIHPNLPELLSVKPLSPRNALNLDPLSLILFIYKRSYRKLGIFCSWLIFVLVADYKNWTYEIFGISNSSIVVRHNSGRLAFHLSVYMLNFRRCGQSYENLTTQKLNLQTFFSTKVFRFTVHVYVSSNLQNTQKKY